MRRVLVVGGGLIGARHLQAVRTHERSELVGLVDPDPAVLPQDPVPRYARMADVKGKVDGVILATPTDLHASQGEEAARRGWHILVEKPVAESLAAAKRLAQSVARAGVGSLVGHHRRYHGSVQQLRDLIAAGEIGTPVTASLIWAMRKPESYFSANWRTHAGSPVMINLVHDIDLLRFVLGEVSAVMALRGANLRGAARIESGAIALGFETGATATISFSDHAPSPWGFEAGTGENPNIGETGQDMLWITGTRGAISFPSMSLWTGTDWSTPASRREVIRRKNAKAPLDSQLDHFLDVMDGATPVIDVADATRTLEVALRIEDQLAEQFTGGSHARSALA